MNRSIATMYHFILKTLWTIKALFVCPVFVGVNGVMTMCGEGEEEKSGEKCGCDGEECGCEGSK